MVKRNIETKIIRFQQSGYLYFPSADFTNFYNVAGDLICASPHGSFNAITQGTGDSNRTGNKIKTVSCRLKVNMWADAYSSGYNASPTPFYVKVWVFECPYNNSTTDVQSVMFNNFMDSNTSSAGMTGLLTDLTGKVNSNIVRLKKVFIRKLGNASLSASAGGATATQYMDNNDFKLTQFMNINLTPYIRKNYRFNDNTTTPFNTMTWVVLEAIPYNDTVPALTSRPGKYSYTLEYSYKDA